MSVVCVKKHNNYFEFAADSICLQGSTKVKLGDFVKLECVNNLIFGAVGYADETALFRLFSETTTPLAPTEKDITDFFFKFYRWKNDMGCGFSSKNIYLIGFKGKAFYVNDMFAKEITEYSAIGAGMDYSLAALHLGCTAEKAVKVACELCCYVSEPIITCKMSTEE